MIRLRTTSFLYSALKAHDNAILKFHTAAAHMHHVHLTDCFHILPLFYLSLIIFLCCVSV